VSVPVPRNEEERLKSLYAYEILDTDSEAAYDDLVRLAATICGVPIAAISLVDRTRVWYKARYGMALAELPRAEALCSYTILNPDGMLIVNDAQTDPRFPGYASTSVPGIVFYAGAPLVSQEGVAIGSLCVAAPNAHSLSEEQMDALRALASQALAQLELRRSLRELKAKSDALSEALGKAESSTRAKSVFLANMSHEVRTPLNGVIGMAEILASTPLSERQRRYVDAIRRSGEGLLGMLNDVLEVVQSEGTEPNLEGVVLASLLEELVGMMQPAAEAKRLWIDLQVDAPLRNPVKADALRLRQVITSLLANAIRFTERGWIQVRAEVLGGTSERRKVRFEIQDSGIGIPPERQTALLNSSEEDIAASAGGGGLGLVLCRRLLANMGGKLAIESELGVGSTFSFKLELDTIDPKVDQRPKRVLVVEDNEVNSMVISAMLEQNGCEVACVENGALAVDLMSREQFDMVFMDLHMPEMDGVTATRRVRAMESGTVHTPIVAVTASAFTEEEARCRDAGMDGLIRKPINERLVREALSQYGARAC